MSGWLLLAAGLAAAAPAPSTLELRCDPRVDLLGVVQLLAGKRAPGPLPGALSGAPSRFAAFKEHPAVRAYARAYEASGGAEAYALILSALSDPPELAWKAPRSWLSRDFIASAGGDEALDAFLRDLRGFDKDSGASAWLAKRRGVCRRAAEEAGRLGAGGSLAPIEAYLGKRLDARGLLAVSFLYTPSRYTAYILPYPFDPDREVKGPFRVFSLLVPEWEFGLPRVRPALGSGALNEFYYLAAEPAYRRHRAAFEARAGLAERMGSACPQPWQNCALHLIVQALAHRVGERSGEGSPLAPGPLYKTQRRLAKALESDYEPGRESGAYRDIDAFWPRLIEALGPASPD